MFFSQSFFIAKRYVFSNNNKAFTNLTYRIAVSGIALGVAILITISSIFNGIDEKMRENLASIETHIVGRLYTNSVDDLGKAYSDLKSVEYIKDVVPRISSYALIQYADTKVPISISIVPEKYWPKHLNNSLRDFLGNADTSAWISSDLFNYLALEKGDTFSILTSKKIITSDSLDPVAVRVRLEAPYESKGMVALQSQSMYLPLEKVASRLNYGVEDITEFAITTKDLMNAPFYTVDLSKKYPNILWSNWSQDAKAFFDSLHVQKNMMIIVLSLVICIASFNLVTGLVILVIERKSEIALLRTIGFRKGQIVNLFIIQSFIIASIGVLIGVFFGVIISYNVTFIVSCIESVLGVELFSEKVFMLSYLPSKLDWYDVLKIIFFSEVLSLVAAVYPSLQAIAISPADILRYE